MFDYICGLLKEKQPQKAIVDAKGIGYKILIPLSTYTKLSSLDSPVTLFISQVIREDSNNLYGFLEKNERNLFETLISISGVGPKTALGIIGHMDANALQNALLSANTQILSKIPGIGKKTAERLVLEMKDKIKTFGKSENDLPISLSVQDSLIADAIGALMNLGYNPKEAQKAVQTAKAKVENETDLGRLITLALRQV